MASFSALPNELVSEVAGYVMPEDIENFSLISKGVYDVVLPLLEEHRVLKKRYSAFQNLEKVEFDGYNPGSRYLVDPDTFNLSDEIYTMSKSKLLAEILTSHRVALYIKELRMWGPFEGWQPKFTSHVSYTKEQLALFKQALSTYVLPSKLETWIEELESGNENPIISLLLILLPNLKCIKTARPTCRTPQLGGVIQRIKTECIPRISILSRLERIDLQGHLDSEQDDRNLIDSLASLATIPSIKSLYGQSIFTRAAIHDFSCLLPQSSNITDLGFDSCNISLRQLDDLFQGLKALQTFHYTVNIAIANRHFEVVPWDPADICRMLSKYAQRSLEVLDLRSENDPVAPIENLREFKVLKKLTLSLSLFQVGGLASKLPVSLEILILHDPNLRHISARDIKDTIREVVRLKPRRFPRLENFCFLMDWCLRGCIKPTDKLRTLCENAGFELCFIEEVDEDRDENKFDWEDADSD